MADVLWHGEVRQLGQDIKRPRAACTAGGMAREIGAPMQDVPYIAAGDLAWLAGWLEGEGHFFGKRYERARGGPGLRVGIQAVSVDEDVILKVQGIVGGSVRGPIWRDGIDNRQPYWSWGVYSRDKSVALMKAVRPYMGQRRTMQLDAAIALEAQVPRKKIGRDCGTYSGYNGGCRCQPCRDACTVRSRERRERERANG